MLTENEVKEIFLGDKKEKKLTDLQRKSLHLFFTMLKDSLNDSGLDMRVVLKPDVDIPWTMLSVKEKLWKPMQMAMLKKDSTMDLNTTEPTQVHELLMKHLGEAFDLPYIPFPDQTQTKAYLNSFKKNK